MPRLPAPPPRRRPAATASRGSAAPRRYGARASSGIPSSAHRMATNRCSTDTARRRNHSAASRSLSELRLRGFLLEVGVQASVEACVLHRRPADRHEPPVMWNVLAGRPESRTPARAESCLCRRACTRLHSDQPLRRLYLSADIPAAVVVPEPEARRDVVPRVHVRTRPEPLLRITNRQHDVVMENPRFCARTGTGTC